METFVSATCPFCGEANEVAGDTSQAETAWVSDCANCCRPFEVRLRCESGEILSLEVIPA